MSNLIFLLIEVKKVRYLFYSTHVILFLSIAHLTNAQPVNNVKLGKFPVDSSYNVISEYNKHIQSFPFITVAPIGDTTQLQIYRNQIYATINHRNLHVDIILPLKNKKKKHPVVMLIHGGGWRSGNKTMEWPMAFELARRGYAAVCVEYRLSPEAVYPAGVLDVQTAIRWVKYKAREYGFDKDKIALMGNSAGGQIASLLGAINDKHSTFTGPLYRNQTNKVQAVVNLDGILAFIHPESGEGQDRPGRPSAATLWFGKPVERDSLSRIEASALTHVNSKTAPMLFINSSIPRFHSGRDDMIQKMNTFGIRSGVYTHDNTMHTFWLFNPWFSKTIELADNFLKEELSKKKNKRLINNGKKP